MAKEIYKLEKNFRFESAHRLSKEYTGKCKNIHGHSWNGKICLEINELDNFDFAIDYSDIKKFIKPIEEELDHTLLVYEKDIELIKFCKNNNYAIVIFKENPTSEVIAKYIYDKAKIYFSEKYPDKNFKITYVEINETCTSSCKYTEIE